MSAAPNYRHRTCIGTRLVSGALALGALALTGAALADGEFEDVPQLEALVRNEATLQFPPLNDRQRFIVGPIDPHLEVHKCGRPVKALSPAHHMQDRLMIELRCGDAKIWHVYVPVRIMGTSPVAVAIHAIVAGSVLKTADLKVEQHDISELPLGYIDDPALASGFTASRPIAGGAFLTNQMLVAAKAVQRGQSVTLIADAGGMTIRMAGRAMSDGIINQRIKVQNLSSGKVVEGVARSEQVVEIVLQ